MPSTSLPLSPGSLESLGGYWGASLAAKDFVTFVIKAGYLAPDNVVCIVTYHAKQDFTLFLLKFIQCDVRHFS